MTPTRPRTTAAIAALAVLSVMLLQQAVGFAMSMGMGLAFDAFGVGYLPQVLQGEVFTVATVTLPFAIGIFLAVWLLLPVTAALTIAQLILRSALAAGVAAAAVFVATVLVSGVLQLAGTFDLWFLRVPPPLLLAEFGRVIAGGAQSATSAFVGDLPSVTLVCVLVWLWLRRSAAGQDPLA